MTITIRPATLDDVADMGQVHVAAWQTAYRGVMPDEFLDGLEPERRAVMWAEVLSDPPEGVCVLVGELEGRIQAIAQVGPFRDRADDNDPTGELWLINAHPDAFGTGLGPRLHALALDQLRCDGHHRAALWVEESNARARRFYEREGWTDDGITKVDVFGGATINEVRYSISL